MRAPGWYYPEMLTYNKSTDVLRRIEYVEFRKYFSDEEWHWEEEPFFKEVTDPNEKAEILKKNQGWLND